MQRRFQQVDVFTAESFRGNPLAVIVDGEGLSDAEMAQIANWTNLSETTFLLPPTDTAADYRVRIFTTTGELPFAGHPTLGSCRVWLDMIGTDHHGGEVVQDCGVGLVRIRRDGDRLAFAAPPLMRSGPLSDKELAQVEAALGRPVVAAAWADNGPGWIAALLPDADAVLTLRPDFSHAPDLKLGVVGPADREQPHDFEVRAFYPGSSGTSEDPVTGSLNASVAMWLMERDPELMSYVARQGTALGRAGRVFVDRDDTATIWIGGDVTTVIAGTITT